MRQFTPAQNVPHLSRQKAVSSIFFTFVGIALLMLLSLIVPSRSFAENAPFPLAATVGSGPDESYLVLNFATGPGETNVPGDDVAFGYLWGGVNNPDPTSWDMINDLTNAGIGFNNVNEDYSFGHYIFGYSYDGLSNGSYGVFSDADGNGWNYYQAGLQDSGTGYPIVSTDNVTSAENGVWSYSDFGPDGISLTDGSVDGWVFDPGIATPALPAGSTAAAPEASTLFSMLTGIALIAGFVVVKKRTTAQRN